jgi:hypothetical protein
LKHLISIAVLLTSLIQMPTFAGTLPQPKTIEQLATSLSEAYEHQSLGQLDATHPHLEKITIVIKDSIRGSKKIKQVKTFEEGERWLKAYVVGGYGPFRESRPLVRCEQGLCNYNFTAGILHNHLYLEKVAYSYRKEIPYIRAIYLLDGD